MKKIIFIMFMTFILYSNNVYAGYKVPDGDFWNKLNDKEKLLYVIGVQAGVVNSLDNVMGDPEIKAQKLEGKMFRYDIELEAEAIVDILNDFYSDSANNIIPITYALNIVRMKIDGASKEDIYTRIQFFRKKIKEINNELQELEKKAKELDKK